MHDATGADGGGGNGDGGEPTAGTEPAATATAGDGDSDGDGDGDGGANAGVDGGGDADPDGGPSTVVVTGSTGRLGPTVVRTLVDAGHRVVGVSRSGVDGGTPAERHVRADCADAGDVYGALTAAGTPDAVVHLGTPSGPRGLSDHAAFDGQVRTTYAVLSAADALGVDRVVVASSLAALGTTFQAAPARVDGLPIDESQPLRATDPYGLGKRAAEVAADGVARRPSGPSVVSLRLPTVFDDEGLRTVLREPDRTLDGIRAAGHFEAARDTLFAWLHVADAARAVERAVVADVDGHEPLWLSAPDTTVDEPSARLARLYDQPGERLSGREPLIDDGRARTLLGWTPGVRRVEGDGDGAGEE